VAEYAIKKKVRGPAGIAQELVLPPLTGWENPAWAATLALWFLKIPGQSPAWSRYVLSVVHLRPIEGAPAVEYEFPKATHQVFLSALDMGPRPRANDSSTWHMLMPVNVSEQIELSGDSDAVRLAELCVKAVLAGMLWAEPPFSGQKEPWHTSLIRTSAHMRGEEHHHGFDGK
jgi:hypothetical protein